MLAVEAIMRALCSYLCDQGRIPDEERQGTPCTELAEAWGVTGLLHDADYEMFKDDPQKHPSKIFEELGKRQVDPRIISAIRSHAWGWRDDLPEPQTKMEWALFCGDELSGLITASALVRPDKKLASLTVESVLNKWKVKSFAGGVNREHVELCESKLGIPLTDFVSIALEAMQGISQDLGL